ncbi:DUF3164 family protein, partial [Rhodopseudomonas parapalustris]
MTATTNVVKGGQVPLKNVASFMTLTLRLQSREPHLPSFGVFYGPSGFGKTEASIYAQNKTNAVRVELGETWSIKKLLQELLFELRIQPKGTIPDLADQVKAALGDDPRRPLIIDEADKLLRKGGMLEVIREIGDVAGCPVILIGEEMLPDKLAVHERFHGRVMDWTAAEECDQDDVAALASATPATADGTVVIGDKTFMHDSSGRLVPVDLIKPQHLLEDQTVRKIVGYAQSLSDQISRFRGHTFDDVTSFAELLAEQYGAKIGGKKGNVTLASYDGLFRVVVQVADQLAF